jgi:hypothetical protein
LNEVQVIGSHNSYRRLPPESVLAASETLQPGLRRKLEYGHPPLAEQLDLGLRLLEIDVFADPEGGRYAAPASNGVLGADEPPPFNPSRARLPGFKVFHIQDFDVYSNCLSLEDCLEELLTWSNTNPGHDLVTVTINVKEETPALPGITRALQFQPADLDAIDALLLETFGTEKLLRPDDVRKRAPTLRQAIETQGWPNHSMARGRFLFVLDAADPTPAERYRQGHPSLRDRVMFATYPETSDEAAIFVIWDIFGHEQRVRDLVQRGFIVRAAADIGTAEARALDYGRFGAVLSTGAQLIATDFYPGHRSPVKTSYEIAFPGSRFTRCAAAD